MLYDPHSTKSKDYYFDHEAGQRVIDFCESLCTHVKGKKARQPLLLEDWQKTFLRRLFGWRHKTTGLRRYRQALLEVPRKNGKTTLAAVVGLYMLLCDNEQGGECYLASTTRDQSGILYDIISGMVRQQKALSSRLKILDSRKRLVYQKTNSFLCAIAAEAGAQHGNNASCIVYDELHAAKTRELYDVLQTSTGAREQPLFLITSTSGWDRHSIMFEIHNYACQVRDGVIDDPTFLPAIYSADEKEDWTDKKTWQKANPNYDVSISHDYLEKECKRAQELPAYENTFRCLHLCQWVEQQTRWLPLSHWQQCQGELPDLSNVPCYGGLDLSNTRDLSSFSLVWPLDGNVYVKTWSWMPKENARERIKTDRVPYDIWAKEGHVIQTDGNVIDYRSILETIRNLATEYDVRTIAYDRYNACPVVLELQAEGLDMVAFGQGYVSMSAPSKELEKRILEHTIIHDGNPLMTWAVSNVSCATDPAANIKPVKPEHKDSKRIDPVVATVMALGMVLAQGEQVNVYDTRGLIVI